MKRRQARHIAAAAFVILTGLGALPSNSNAAEQRAGIFQLNLPPAFTPVTGVRLDEMRRALNAGSRGLAQIEPPRQNGGGWMSSPVGRTAPRYVDFTATWQTPVGSDVLRLAWRGP